MYNRFKIQDDNVSDEEMIDILKYLSNLRSFIYYVKDNIIDAMTNETVIRLEVKKELFSRKLYKGLEDSGKIKLKIEQINKSNYVSN